jgi:hypothetical protein
VDEQQLAEKFARRVGAIVGRAEAPYSVLIMWLGRKNLRGVIGLIAVLGVLMHAGLLARHHTMALAAAFDPFSMLNIAGAICTGDGAIAAISDEDGPSIPSKSDMQGKCPICLGMAAANAILSEPIEFARLGEPVSERIVVVGQQIAERIGARLPPSRAPPVPV